MIVIYCYEIQPRSGDENNKLERTYERIWRAKVDIPDATSNEILAIPDIPDLNSVYLIGTQASDIGALVSKRRARQDADNPYVWEITVNYDTKQPDPSKITENPLQKIPEVDWDFQRYSKPIVKDRHFNAIRNSAGDVYDPPAEKDATRVVLTITSNKADFNVVFALDFRDVVNRTSFLGADPRQAKVMSLKAKRQSEKGLVYFAVTAVIEFHDETFDLVLLDIGYNELIGGVRTPIREKDGTLIQTPMLLDGNGVRLAPNAQPVFNTFEVYEEQDFALLNILI